MLYASCDNCMILFPYDTEKDPVKKTSSTDKSVPVGEMSTRTLTQNF